MRAVKQDTPKTWSSLSYDVGAFGTGVVGAGYYLVFGGRMRRHKTKRRRQWLQEGEGSSILRCRLPFWALTVLSVRLSLLGPSNNSLQACAGPPPLHHCTTAASAVNKSAGQPPSNSIASPNWPHAQACYPTLQLPRGLPWSCCHNEIGCETLDATKRYGYDGYDICNIMRWFK